MTRFDETVGALLRGIEENAEASGLANSGDQAVKYASAARELSEALTAMVFAGAPVDVAEDGDG